MGFMNASEQGKIKKIVPKTPLTKVVPEKKPEPAETPQKKEEPKE
jgi:hypothetical protein